MNDDVLEYVRTQTGRPELETFWWVETVPGQVQQEIGAQDRECVIIPVKYFRSFMNDETFRQIKEISSRMYRRYMYPGTQLYSYGIKIIIGYTDNTIVNDFINRKNDNLYKNIKYFEKYYKNITTSSFINDELLQFDMKMIEMYSGGINMLTEAERDVLIKSTFRAYENLNRIYDAYKISANPQNDEHSRIYEQLKKINHTIKQINMSNPFRIYKYGEMLEPEQYIFPSYMWSSFTDIKDKQ